MDAKIIRTEDQHHQYLAEIQKLMSRGSALSSAEFDRLEVLTVIVESYENEKHAVEPPGAIDAILFRMEEKGLKQADLIPYFGTSSRVSEVLKGKRPLTVQMIRALALGLGISADTLVGLSEVAPAKKTKPVDWAKFPVKEMMSRGWFEAITGTVSTGTEDLIKSYISDAGIQFGAASFRRTLFGDAESPSTRYAIFAWVARVVQRSRVKKDALGKFHESVLCSAFLRELAQLSWWEKGPLLAIELLEKNGIAVVIESQLKGTRLDGAALKDLDGTPVIGLTLRYDRLDSFWFTLIHEVAHLWKHVSGSDTFVDDLNIDSEDRREAEANRLAKEAFIPRLIWKRSDAYLTPSKETIEDLSRELRIHPAVIVGRLRKETGNYAIFSDLVGQSEVRHILSSVVD